jgi:hypothetical protein
LAEACRDIEPPARGSQAIAETPPRFSSGGVFVRAEIKQAQIFSAEIFIFVYFLGTAQFDCRQYPREF